MLYKMYNLQMISTHFIYKEAAATCSGEQQPSAFSSQILYKL